MPLVRDLTKFTTTSPIVASFSFTDLITGQGFVQYLAYTSKDETATNYQITTNSSLVSRDIETGVSNGTNLPFDSPPFQNTQTASGTAIIAYSLGGSGVGNSMKVAWTIDRVRGTAVTNIGSITSETWDGTGNVKSQVVEIPLTKTTFAAGDFLRVRAIFTIGAAAGVIGTDPASRAGAILSTSTAPTKTSFWIPWEINL